MTITAGRMHCLHGRTMPTLCKFAILLFATVTCCFQEASTASFNGTRNGVTKSRGSPDSRTLQASTGSASPINYGASGVPQDHSSGLDAHVDRPASGQRRAALGISSTNSAQRSETTLRGCMAHSSGIGPFSVQQYTEGQPARCDASCLLCFPLREMGYGGLTHPCIMCILRTIVLPHALG